MRSLRIRADRRRGFALLIVLWVLVLISFVAAQVVASGRTEMRIAENLYAHAAADAAAEGGVEEALFRLSDPPPDRAWQADSGLRELTIGRSRVTLRVENEAAYINPNFATPAILEGLLRATGSDPPTASQLAMAIAEWVGTTVARRPPGALEAEYRAAGLDYAPPQQPMESLDELARVRGMTPAVFAAIRPHLSLYAPQVPDLSAADPVVAAALDFVRGQPGGLQLPSGRGGTVTARIVATAHGPAMAEATRTAVVRFDTAARQIPLVLAWEAVGE